MFQTPGKHIEIRKLPPVLSVAALLFALALSDPLTAQSLQCDCSCDNYSELAKATDEYQAKAQAGAASQPPAAFMEMITCSATCGQQWSNCPKPG